MKRVGAMAFIVSGLVKDIIIMCTASYPLEAIQCSRWQLALGWLSWTAASGNLHWACSAGWTRWAQPRSMDEPCGTEPGSAYEDQVPIGQSPPHVAHNSGGLTLTASMAESTGSTE